MLKNVIIVLCMFVAGICILDLRITCLYRSLLKASFSKQSFSRDIEALRRLLKLRSLLCGTHSMRQIYNTVCVMEASAAYCREDEASFLRSLDRVVPEQGAEEKYFLRALFYSAKGDMRAAKTAYGDYLECEQYDKNAANVLRRIIGKETVEINLSAFHNPATRKLLSENGVPLPEEEAPEETSGIPDVGASIRFYIVVLVCVVVIMLLVSGLFARSNGNASDEALYTTEERYEKVLAKTAVNSELEIAVIENEAASSYPVSVKLSYSLGGRLMEQNIEASTESVRIFNTNEPSYAYYLVFPTAEQADLIVVISSEWLEGEDGEHCIPFDTLGTEALSAVASRNGTEYPVWVFAVPMDNVDDGYVLHYGENVLDYRNILRHTWAAAD